MGFDLVNNPIDSRIRKQFRLAGEGGFDLASEGEPFLSWSWGKISQRADGAMAWAFWGKDRFDEEIVYVGFVFGFFGGPLDEHR